MVSCLLLYMLNYLLLFASYCYPYFSYPYYYYYPRKFFAEPDLATYRAAAFFSFFACLLLIIPTFPTCAIYSDTLPPASLAAGCTVLVLGRWWEATAPLFPP
jgi:hypothetical protein